MMKEELVFLKVFGEIDEHFIYLAAQPWKKTPKFVWPEKIGIRVACVVLVLILGLTCVFHTEVRASWKRFTTMIAQFLGIEDDLSPYAEVKNTSLTKNGLTLTLKEVILDKDELIVLIEKSGDVENAKDFEVSSTAWIDNQEILTQKSMMTDGQAVSPRRIVLSYRFGEETVLAKDIVNIRLELLAGPNSKSIGTYIFEFSASKAEMEKATINKPLAQEVQIDQNYTMKFTEFTQNAAESSIIAYCDNLPGGAEYSLKGKDNNGNNITYRLMTYENPMAVFVKDEGCMISPDASSLELQMYKHMGEKVIGREEVDEYIIEDAIGEDVSKDEAVGNAFSINIKAVM